MKKKIYAGNIPIPWGVESHHVYFYTVEDVQGRILNLIECRSRFTFILQWNHVDDLHWDVAKISYLWFLFREAMIKKDTGFMPSKILKVAIPPDAEVYSVKAPDPYDRSSRFPEKNKKDLPLYKWLRTSKIAIIDTYALDSVEDMKRLVKEGYFNIDLPQQRYESSLRLYQEWIEVNRQAELYVSILQEKAIPLKPNAELLLRLVGTKDWRRFLSYLYAFEVSTEQLVSVLFTMSDSILWETWQAEDILRMGSFTRDDFAHLLHYKSIKRFDFFRLFFLKFLNRSTFPTQPDEIRYLVNLLKSHDLYFVYAYSENATKQHDFFTDYPLLRTLAAVEDYNGALATVLKDMPEAQRHSRELLQIALATENETLLQQLAFTAADIAKVRAEEEALVKKSKEKEAQLILKATRACNTFQVAYLAPRLFPKDLVTPMLDAAKEGMLGIVKILVEQGHAAPDCWDNFPIKHANKEGYQRLKKYLLSKGAKDSIFSS